MWVSITKDWHEQHTELSRYFIERLKQKVDPTEVISNKHKTTNGFTLIGEIIQVIDVALIRRKSLNRLISILEEAKSQIDSSLINDYIIIKYHPDIISFIKNLTPSQLKGSELAYLKHSFTLFHQRLSDDYYENISSEFSKIDFAQGRFERESRLIDKLIDCLIPYLLNEGFSPQSINEIAYWFIRKKDGYTVASKFLDIFRRKYSGL